MEDFFRSSEIEYLFAFITKINAIVVSEKFHFCHINQVKNETEIGYSLIFMESTPFGILFGQFQRLNEFLKQQQLDNRNVQHYFDYHLSKQVGHCSHDSLPLAQAWRVGSSKICSVHAFSSMGKDLQICSKM